MIGVRIHEDACDICGQLSLSLPSLNPAVGPHPLSVLLPENSRPRVAVDGARQVDATSDREPGPVVK